MHDSAAEFHKTGMGFLIADLELGLTFMDVAGTSTDADTARRNHANARTAYETVLGMKSRVALTPAEEALVNDKLDLLKARLDDASLPGVTPPD